MKMLIFHPRIPKHLQKRLGIGTQVFFQTFKIKDLKKGFFMKLTETVKKRVQIVSVIIWKCKSLF